jgi:hypothetical protein
VNNIERLVTKLGIDLYTEVLDWPQFRDLQIAFLQSSTPDLEIPTDHAIEAVLMSQAKLHGIKYVLGGSNIRTEGILPSSWSQGIRDWRYIRSVHEQFGSIPIDSFPHFNVAGFITWRLRGHRKINLLNFIDYNKSTATRVLETELDWLPYGTKHGESVYTRFFQNYILPKKFGYDKRRAHLSALVCAGEIGRADALTALETPPALPEEIQQDREFVARKLGFGVERLDSVLALPNRTMSDYPNYESTWWYQILQSIYRLPRVLRRPRR